MAAFDFYPLIRPLLFRLDAEKAHHLTIRLLKNGLAPRLKTPQSPQLESHVFGLYFPNPIGLAAGFDKQAEAIEGVLHLGFGFVELGTIVPLPQAGNALPRLFRVPSAEAVINRFGFNSDGLSKTLPRVQKFFARGHKHAPVGLNVGKNKDSAALADDYVAGIEAFAPHADYLTVNISSPNTPGLRDLQRRQPLEDLLRQALAARARCARRPPLLVKIAPDVSDEQLQDIAEVALASGINGIIIGNTTLSRPANIPSHLAAEAGGLSGRPLSDLSTSVLRKTYQLTNGKLPLIGCGGIFTGADAYTKIRAGASLIQLYTSLIYEGPFIVQKIARELAELLKRDGYSSLTDAIGADFKKENR